LVALFYTSSISTSCPSVFTQGAELQVSSFHQINLYAHTNSVNLL
jgi:hypothetical protein